MSYRFIKCLSLFLGFFIAAKAQNGNIYLEDSNIKVVAYGKQRTLAWCGGFNSAQFANADLNHDGLQDLVVFEWKEKLLRTFINKGTASVADYRYAPEYAKNFPPCNDYIKMEDYNRDGVPDLIHRGVQGFAIYRGYYSASNQLKFTFYKDLRFNAADGIGNINAYTQGSDIPGIIDIDGDGDLDFFGYNVTGGLIDFYKNCQVEHGLPKDSIEICNPTHCWGHVFQGADRGFTFGIIPYKNSPSCSTLGTFNCKIINGEKVVKETRHQGNCMLLLDIDGDGDVDLLDGNISFSDLQYVENGRAQYGGSDSLVAEDTFWQYNKKPVYLPSWPSPTFADADGDGKKDILITPHNFGANENYRCVQFYKNTGTIAAPNYNFQSDTLFIDKTIDAGSASYPVLYDFNRDGKLDLFLGSDGYYDAGGFYKSRISYYQNSRSGTTTSFTLQTTDFGGISAQNFAGAAPAFGDLDGDSVDDMVIGHSDGTLSFYKNMANSNLLQPQWVLSQLMMKSLAGDTINVGYYASPYIYDIDSDGTPDLLIGNESGRLVYYKSTATGSGLALTKVTSTLGDVKANAENTFSGYSSFWIGKMDVTRKDFLITGNDLGNLVRYTGFQNGNVTSPYRLVDSAYSGIDVGSRSTITAGDIDGDGKIEMIIGNSLGGLFLYKQGPVLNVADYTFSQSGCSLYPNPASSSFVVKWEGEFASGAANVHVVVFNTLGQQVREVVTTADKGAVTIPASGLADGIYTCQVRSNGKTVALRLSILQ